MARTCLQIIQTACQRIGISSPNAAVTSTDQQIQQLVALSNLEGEQQAARYNWEALCLESVFTTVAAQLQGTVATLAPGLKFIQNNTIWNRSLRRPIPGALSAQEWQEMQAMSTTSPFGMFRIKGGSLYIYPTPVAGNTCAFEYVTRNWVTLAAGGTSNVWGSDSDTPLLDDDRMIQGLVWRWKQAKGLDYAEDYAAYEQSLTDAMARNGGKPYLSMNGGGVTRSSIPPVVIVPSGSW